jgi:hypothetical protein
MSNTFVFDTVSLQNSGNTVYEFTRQYEVANGVPYQFKTDAERMLARQGQRGKERTSGYAPYLYTKVFNLPNNYPSTLGPSAYGWGRAIASPGPKNPLSYTEIDINGLTGQSNYYGIISKGFVYSPSNTTIQFRTTSDDGVYLQFNGTPAISNWTLHGPTLDYSSSLTLRAGYTPILLNCFNWAVNGTYLLEYSIGGNAWTADGTGTLYYNASST